MAQFGGTSAADVRRLRELRREFMGIDTADLVNQRRGHVHLGFSECADPTWEGHAVPAVLRPTCIHAGGETLEVNQDADEEDEGED